MKITIRPLQSSEWVLLQEIRLKALKTNPQVFSSSYETEKNLSPDEWKSWLTQDNKCVFGLFDQQKIIGLTSIFTLRDDPTGQTALLATSYIEPEYRGQGLSRMFYEARLGWVKTQPQFRKIVVSHRESNEASRRANQSFGFQYIGRRPHIWPDGVSEDEIMYELKAEDLQKMNFLPMPR
ncbi:MAG: GNAT family N-acetyltransferase [Micavibrio sp.]